MAFELIIRGNTSLTTHDNKHDFYYRNSCKVCPLRQEPSIEPYGATKPVVYLLGEAAGREEIQDGRPFVGQSGQMLRRHIPEQWYDERHLLRWNNCIKARPPNNRTPTAVELACCRSLLEDDIVASKPAAIFGFGAVPLSWAGLAGSGITAWAGRYAPINVRNMDGEEHACWYFPMVHPSYVCRKVDEAHGEPRAGYTSEHEFAFHMHLKNAFALVNDIDDQLGPPVVHTRDMAMEGIEWTEKYDDDSVNRILRHIEAMYSERVAGFDYETNKLRPYNKGAKILTASLAGAKSTLAWPHEHREARWTKGRLDTIEDALVRFLREAHCTVAVHNSAFEQEWSAVFYGRDLARKDNVECTMSQAYVIDERQASSATGGPLSLDWLCRQYFGFSIKALSRVDRANLDNALLSEVLPYNGCDAKYHRLVHRAQARRIEKEGLQEVYCHHMRRVRAAVLTQIKGLPVDHDVSYALQNKYEGLERVAEEAIDATPEGKEFRSRRGYALKPSNNKDLAFLIEHILTSPNLRKVLDSDGRVPNVTEATLSTIKHKVTNLILDWKKAHKVLSTYIWPVLPDSEHLYDDGLLHPQTRTTTVVTWRTSSDGINYQNFPKRNEERREVRGQVKRKGYKVVSFDYAGIQARNVAMESKDPELVKAFRERYDIHSDWTEQIARLHPAWIKEGVKELARNKALFRAYRNKAKNEFVFPSLFGARDTTVAHYMGIPDEIGVKAQKLFWGRFGGVFEWHAYLLEFYRDRGYVTGLSDWRRHAPISPNELINTPIQSDESAIVLDAMCRLSELRRWELQPNMEIHDDLTFIWPEADVDRNARIVMDTMLKCPFKWAQIVPLGVEWSVGDDWHKQKAVKEYFSDTWDGKL